MHNKSVEGGFSLLELLIAIMVFSVFITAYMASEGFNIADSNFIKRQLRLKNLAQAKINSILINLPEFEESLTLTPVQGNLEEFGHGDVEFKVTYRRLKLPDFSKLMNQEKDEDKGAEEEGGGSETADQDTSATSSSSSPSSSGGKNAEMEKKVFQTLSQNMEEYLWQLQLKVNEKGQDYSYTLSTWVVNPKAKMNIRM